MGFWKSLFGISDSKSIEENGGKYSDLNTTFVSYNEEKKFEESIYGTLQLFESDVSYISEVLPERGQNLEKQIELLTALLERTNNEDDPEVINVFKELKKQYEEDKRMADGEYTISELEHQNKIMDSIFEKCPEDGGIRKENLDEYISFISKVQKKVTESEINGKPILNKVQRQKFNNISMKSEYRIKMLELMYLLNRGEVKINPFKDLSPTRQKIFSKMFYEDAQITAKQYENLSVYEEAYKEWSGWLFPTVDSTAKKLNAHMANAKMIDDFSIRQLFDSNNQESKSFEFLKEFVNFKSKINEMIFIQPKVLKQKREKEERERKAEEEKILKEQEEKRLKEEAERKAEEEFAKYKSYTDLDIRKEIYRIEHDLTSKGSRFVNILDFQKKVAKAKGLLDSDENLQKEGIVYKAVDAITAWEIVKKANTMGVSYAMFPDCQEGRDGGFMIAISEEDKNVLSVDREKLDFSNASSNYDWRVDENIGQFPGFILNELNERIDDTGIRNIMKVNADGMVYLLQVGYNGYGSKPSNFNKRKEKIYENLKEVIGQMDQTGASAEELQDVMCYISIPATTNIIPILEVFKENGVTPYIEPVPEKNRNENNRNNIQIYFERDQLELFQNQVLEQISNSEMEVIGVKWANKSMGTAIREQFDWKFLNEKGKEDQDVER